jgi:hypothetical protein
MILDGKPFDFNMNMDMKDMPKVELDGKRMRLQIEKSMRDAEKAQEYLKEDTVRPDASEKPEVPEKPEAPEQPETPTPPAPQG